LHTRLVFSGFAGASAPGAPAGDVRVLLRIFQDEEDLGLYEATVTPSDDPATDVLIRPPVPLGGSPHGEPHVPAGPYEDAVRAYVDVVLARLEEAPGDPAAYSIHHAVEFDAGDLPGSDPR
jgi:hypothetical protein